MHIATTPTFLRRARLAGFALTACSLAPGAEAALGGDIDSIARDQARIGMAAPAIVAKTQRQIPAGAAHTPSVPGNNGAELSPGTFPSAYTVHEIATPSGTVVREFAAADGRVFAVAWSGPTMPDLRQLLGENFAIYAAPPASGPRAHAHRTLTRGDLVVQSSGRMRAFSGRAYLSSLVPSGVAIDGLR